MPEITITARLIRLTRPVSPGQWILLHPDDRYEILDHAQAMILQGRQTRHRLPRDAKPPPKPTPKPAPKIADVLEASSPKSSITVNGKTLTITGQRLAILQYMAAHGQMTVEEAVSLIGQAKTSILSSLKTLGLLSSKPDLTKLSPTGMAPHIYFLTNEGRALATGTSPAA